MRSQTRNSTVRFKWLAVAVLVAFATAFGPPKGLAAQPGDDTPVAKNVILMVTDGAGFNTWRAASMYRGKLGEEVYDTPEWLLLGSTTYPLSKSADSTEQDPRLVYDTDKAWDPEEGYDYLKSTATDSAAAGTALATGLKTYNGAVNWQAGGSALQGRSLPECAHKLNKAAGIITTVQISHATPATLGGAHNRSRHNYSEIADEMLHAEYLQVIMGAGHPEYDNNAQIATDDPGSDDCKYVGGRKNWRLLKSGTHPDRWTLVETKAEFESLLEGDTPERVLGLATVATTLQQSRSRPIPLGGGKTSASEPFAVPMNENVPSLALMTRAAINCLDDDPDGFYLGIEGGAVDWANHGNQAHRMIEEQIDFIKAVEAVVEWVEENSSWEETLVILTSDHDCGLPWGPESDEIPFQPLVDNGPGSVPGMQYNSGGHSNMLVPVYARGPGAELLLDSIRGTDAQAAEVWEFSGNFVDNTDISRTIQAAMTAAEPVAAE